VPANYFDQRIAGSYREKWPEIHRPEVIEPTVGFLAGLTLQERWADWSRNPFTSESRSHVSVWQKAGS
jgi:hypothetical protein